MNQIAIAAHPADLKFAQQLAGDLEEAGARVWLRAKDVPLGSDWQTNLQEGLRRADAMLIILSPEAMRDPLVTSEWEDFLRSGRPIVPLYWRECEPHFKLSRLQYVDFRKGVIEYARAFNHLLLQLNDDHPDVMRLRPGRPTHIPQHRLVADILLGQTGIYYVRTEERKVRGLLILSVLVVLAGLLLSLWILAGGLGSF
jgi:hypothetical protein